MSGEGCAVSGEGQEARGPFGPAQLVGGYVVVCKGEVYSALCMASHRIACLLSVGTNGGAHLCSPCTLCIEISRIGSRERAYGRGNTSRTSGSAASNSRTWCMARAFGGVVSVILKAWRLSGGAHVSICYKMARTF